MGTSSVRRAPSTRLWRLAKGAATRYLAPENGSAVTAGEVVARYLAALGEETGPAGISGLASFRATRRTAQDLGAFLARAASQGLKAALQDRGLDPLMEQTWPSAAQGLGASLAGRDAGLEETVARTSLAQVLTGALPVASPETAARLVRQFLATALFLRLALDLGEPLEAAAASQARFQAGLAGIRDLIAARAGEWDSPPAPGSPAQWQGLKGWNWVTAVLQALLTQLEAKKSPFEKGGI
jgi:hypothetical protein